MAIVPLAKLNLFGSADQKEAVLDELQQLGCVHLVSFGQPQEIDDSPDISSETRQAVKYLRSCPIRRRAVSDDSDFQFEDVVREARYIELRQQQLQEDRDELLMAIGNLMPWGNFRLPAEGELGALRLWFYIVPHYRLRLLSQRDETWHVVSRDRRFAYVVVISAVEPEQMPVARVHLDGRPLRDLQQQLEETETELEELHWQRVTLTRWSDLLARTIALAGDQTARQHAARQAWSDPSLFVIQGWIPTVDKENISEFSRVHSLGMTIEPPSDNDTPPTLLSNTGLTAGGQGAVTFYTTPAYRSWDPSSIVFFSFSIFFAMIMADAGYALLLGGLVLLLWRRIGRLPGGKRLRTFGLAIVFASLGYGVAVGSYFGFPPGQRSFLQTLHVIDAADTTLMMQISIALGVAHLSLANLAKAWNRRWAPQMLGPLGWMVVLMGGLAMGFGRSGIEPQVALVKSGGWSIVMGVIAVLLFSSERPWRTRNLGQHGLRLVDGLLSLTNISRAFGDVLSYLRLFALGLASAQLASTFNDLTYKASCCFGVGSLLAVIVVAFGHGLNFALAIMSGVVHGLRLNCIEFFGWGLPEEGYPFEPFCRKAARSWKTSSF